MHHNCSQFILILPVPSLSGQVQLQAMCSWNINSSPKLEGAVIGSNGKIEVNDEHVGG